MKKVTVDSMQFIPVVIGVTGHRDIPVADIPILKEAIKKQLNGFRDRCPNSPLLLVTGLAEGADRLVAQCALELNALEAEKTIWSIGAILALPQADFEQDFDSEASIAEFRDLLAACTWRQVAPAGVSRPVCYELVGKLISLQAQWLIALWDGQDNDKRGGTASVVRLFREGIKQARPVLPDTGPVAHILTRRISALTETDLQGVGSIAVLPPILPPDPRGSGREGIEISRWEKILERIDEFNCRIGKLTKSDWNYLKEKCRAGINRDQALDDAELGGPALRASWLYAAAEYLAQEAQRKRNSQFLSMLVLAFCALGFDQYYSGPAEGEGWRVASWLVLALLCGVFALIPTILSFLNPEARYLEYRALAESCRVQFFWKRAGIVKCAADYHLFDQRDELEWIRQAVRTTELADTNPETIQSDRILNIKDCWITHQKDYYSGVKRGFPYHEKRAKILNATSFGFLALAGVVIVVAVVVQVSSTSNVVKWLQFVYGMLLTCAGATKVFLHTQGHEEHARSYLRTGQSMLIAENMLSTNIENVKVSQEILYEVGREALNENGDWLLLHRERPVHPPI